MPKLRPEVKEEWVRRLRSGDYRQIQGRLRSVDGGYCCLGVLQEMYMETIKMEWKDGVETPEGMEYLPDTDCWRWAGIKRTEAGITYLNERRLLDEWNDEGTPFPVIADLIEEQL